MKRYIYYICLPLLFYPVYFSVANFVDSVFGDQQLINWLYFDSRSILIKTFISDWVQSLPVMYAILFLLLLPVEYISKKIAASSAPLFFISMAIIAVLSYFAGFREIGLLINTAAMLCITAVYYFSKTSFVSVPNK